MKTPRVLVTGAIGYIGGRLVTALADQGRSVVGGSRRQPALPRQWPSNARLCRLDLADDIDHTARCLDGVDCIVHLAAANEIDSGRDPDQAIIDTGLGARRLLEAAIVAQVPRMVFLSTIHVYGAPLMGRLDEDRVAWPSHPYSIAHRLGEDFVLAAHQAGRIEGVVARLSNGIGAPAWAEVDRWSLIGNDLALQAARTGRLVLKTPGTQWRDFITLPDVIQGLTTLIDAAPGDLGNGLFNLGGNLRLRIVDVAYRVAEAARIVLGQELPVIRPEGGDDSPPTFDFPTTKIERLGFSPTADRWLQTELEAAIRLVL